VYSLRQRMGVCVNVCTAYFQESCVHFKESCVYSVQPTSRNGQYLGISDKGKLVED